MELDEYGFPVIKNANGETITSDDDTSTEAYVKNNIEMLRQERLNSNSYLFQSIASGMEEGMIQYGIFLFQQGYNHITMQPLITEYTYDTVMTERVVQRLYSEHLCFPL